MKHLKTIYSNWAKIYDLDSKFNPATQMQKGIILPTLKPKKSDIILDIGCGTGRFTIPIAKKCKKVIAVDISEEMLGVAKDKSKNIDNIHYLKLDASRKLPFKNNYFDKIVCTLVVSHIKNLEKFLKEIKRVLKKRGILIYDDFAADFKKPFKTNFDDIMQKARKEGIDIFSYHSINKHVNTLHRLNFDILETKYMRIDKKIKHTLSPSTYERNEGRTIAVLFKAEKT